MKQLFLFTGKFPFTITTECFLEDEILYLARRFDLVHIIPLQRETAIPKKIPANCIIVNPILENRFLSCFRGIFNLKAIRLLLHEFFGYRVYKDRVKLLNWIKCYYISNNLLNSGRIRTIGKSIKENDVCYFYWGKWSNLLSVFWNGKCHMVSRFHGEFDLWEEVHHGYVPLREKVVNALDAAVFISSKGERYFNNKYPNVKTIFIPLGSTEIQPAIYSTSDSIRVLSCSNVIPLKRVDLLYKSLLEIKNKSIKWVHIGSGSEMDKLRLLVNERKSKSVQVELLGSMNHKDVVEYYKNNCFDVFVNLSTIEGVPVSIMEAISCNIPVVATDVGGTSEVVNNETGILVSSSPDTTEVATAICDVVKLDLQPRIFWEKNYDAVKNYTEFTDYIYSL